MFNHVTRKVTFDHVTLKCKFYFSQFQLVGWERRNASSDVWPRDAKSSWFDPSQNGPNSSQVWLRLERSAQHQIQVWTPAVNVCCQLNVVQYPSESPTVSGFRMQSYASPDHSIAGPSESRTLCPVASLDRFIKKRVMNKIFFMPKRSRLEVKKTSVRLSNGKNKMAAIRKPDTNPAFKWSDLA